MLVDALACTVAGLVGTTTSGAYIESASGIREGARTGLAAAGRSPRLGSESFATATRRPSKKLTDRGPRKIGSFVSHCFYED